jgi:UDP-glucose 4-epimerase
MIVVNVLVTGGTGFVGLHVASKFLTEDFGVIGYDVAPREFKFVTGSSDHLKMVKGDILNLQQLLETIEQYDVDGVVHTAALVIEARAKEAPWTAYKINVEGTANVLEAARKKDLKLVYLCSAIVYGNSPDLRPLNEDDSVGPVGIYGTTKLMGELMTLGYGAVYGLDAVSVRTCWVYGPLDIARTNPISLFLENAISGQPTEKLSGYDHSLDFTYVKDLATGIFLAYNKRPINNRVFNVTGGKFWKLGDVADVVTKIVPHSIVRLGPGLWEGFAVRGPCDITRAREELKYEPQYSLEKGITDYARWIMEQQRA